MSFDELRMQQERRKRLLNLTLTCGVVLALIALGACGPASDVEIADGNVVSGDPTADEQIEPVRLPPAERLVTTTSTTVASTTTTHYHPPTTTTEVPVHTAAASSSPPTPAVVSPPGSGCGGWEELIASYFPNEVGTACRIIMCESGGNPNAVSPTGDHGLAQINEATWNKPGHHDPVADWIGRHWHSVYDPDVNLQMAAKIRDAYGWQMWSCY